MKDILLFILAFFIVFNLCAQNGLVAHFPLDETAEDISNQQLNGEAHNTLNTVGINDQMNTALYFNGTAAYIDCGNENRNITDTISISVWIKTEMTTNGFIVTKYDYNNDRGFHLSVNNGFIKLGGRNNSGSYSNTGNTGISINDGEWHHILARIYGNNWDLWVDCEWSSSTQSNASSPSLINTEPLSIGYFALENNRFFKGEIDEIRIYNKLLSETEIETLCSNEITSTFSLDQNGIKFFPNPVYNTINISGLNKKVQILEVYDFGGKKLFSIKKPKSEIDLSQLSSGSYILNFLGENNKIIHREKIVKAKRA